MQDRTKTQAGITPSPGATGTPGQSQAFTTEDVDKAVKDARSADRAEIGRLRSQADSALAAAKAAQERLDRSIKEADERELEEARDDPPRLTALQERQKRRAAESELVTARQELNQKGEQLTQLEKERSDASRERIVKEVSDRFKVDPARLAKLARFSEGTPEAIEDIAKELSAGGSKPLKPDSGIAVGGNLNREQIIANYVANPRNPSSREQYHELRRKEGR